MSFCLNSHVKWVTSDDDKSSMKNTFKFTGVSLTRGKFFNGGKLTFAVGAPKDNNYRGAVYVCKVRLVSIRLKKHPSALFAELLFGET